MPEEKKKIVFYSATTPTVMIYKMAKLLKKNGYETILFAICEKERINYNLYSEAFDKIICSNFQFMKSNLTNPFYLLKRIPSLINFLIYMKLLKPYIIIGVSGSNWQLKLTHKYFLKKYPFIYFPYDILSHYIGLGPRPPEFEIKAEKYLFENSEGIIHKGDINELDYIKENIYPKLNISEKQLSFLPYCSKEFIVPINKDKISEKEGGIHLVYIGFLFNDPASSKKFKYFLKELISQKINIHIYTLINHISKEQENNYINNFFSSFKDNKYLHLHFSSFGEKEIVSEISKYDFGIWPVPSISKELGTGNKLASYLEAGLPFFCEDTATFLCEKIMKQYKIDLTFNKDNIESISKKIKKLNYEKIIEKIEKARNDFDMDKNFLRLQNFIEEIARES